MNNQLRQNMSPRPNKPSSSCSSAVTTALLIATFAVTSCIVVQPKKGNLTPGTSPPPETQNVPGSPCGASGQRPCNVWERIPSCDSGLYEDFDVRKCQPRKISKRKCGGLGMTPCKIWEQIPSCDRGLVEDFLAGKCLQAGQADGLARIAAQVLSDTSGLIRIATTALTCVDPKNLEHAVRRNDPVFAKKLMTIQCFINVQQVAQKEGYSTLTVGISGGGSFVLGTFLDTGFAFDLTGKREPTLYQTKAISIGFQAGIGAGLNIGVYKGSNAVNTAGSDTQGLTFEAGAGVGGGAGVWFDYEGRLDGISVSVIAGASGKAGAYNRINTSYYSITGANPIGCGMQDQRACKVWERIPSCDKGLYEDLGKGMCRKKAPLRCGAESQRACKVWERIPSCNRGLYEVIGKGVCKRKPKLNCGAKNQRPCKVWERIPSCNKGLKEHFFKGKCV